MSRRLLAVICVFALCFASAPLRSLAQGASVEEKPSSGGPRKQLATILYAGLGGAVLGLSTLSFYGRPQDKLANIAIGFAVGVIGGTAVVTYNAATNPDDFYGTASRTDSNEWRYRDDDRERFYVAASHRPEETPVVSASFKLLNF